MAEERIYCCDHILLMGLMGIGQVSFNSSVILEIHRMILSAIGSLIFFIVDYSLVVVLETFFPIESAIDKKRKLIIFLFCSTCLHTQLSSMNKM